MFVQCGYMSYFSIVSVLATVDGGRRAPSLEKQAGVPTQI